MLEQSLVNHEYCDIVRRNLIDGLFENNYDSTGNTQGKGFNLIIDDDILLGKVNLASTQTKLKVKDEEFNSKGEE